MTPEQFDDSVSLRANILDLEEPIMELRDGIRAVLAMNPNVAIGDAGIPWVAGKLQEASELLQEQWRGLVATSRSENANDTGQPS